MGRLLVLRHAQSVWNAAGRWQGWADVALSKQGEDQARQAAEELSRRGTVVAAIACSDLQRAKTTAQLLAEGLAYDGPLRVDPELREHDVGQWTGLTTDEIALRWPGQMEALGQRSLEAFPGGENLGSFQRRVKRATLRLAEAVAGKPDDMLVVCHGGVMTEVERWIGVWRPERRHPNLSGWWLSVTGSSPAAGLEPDTPVHLLGGSVAKTVPEVA